MTDFNFSEDEVSVIVDIVLVFLDASDDWVDDVEDGTAAHRRLHDRRETLASVATKLGWSGTLVERDRRRRDPQWVGDGDAT